MSTPDYNAMSTPDFTRLEPLVGDWEITVPQFPGAVGQVSFEWLPGEKFLVQRWSAPDPAPDGIAVIGVADDDAEEFVQHYFDSRGVKRQYRMALAEGVWRLWRDEDPAFRQRFEARVSADGRRMTGMWETSVGGSEWEKDFDMEYVRQS